MSKAGRKKPLSVTHPHLLEEWDFEKNEIRPEDITHGSHKRVWWSCGRCHKWRTRVSHRVNGSGCPICIGNTLSENNKLSVVYPGVSSEWNYDKNTFGPAEISGGSKKKVWWLCPKCAYEWRARVANRTYGGRGCPRCAGKILDPRNSLEYRYPHIARQWSYDKNKGLCPADVSYASSRKVFWECAECGLLWKALIYNRTLKQSGCPKCSKGPVSRLSSDWLDSLTIPALLREHHIKELNVRVDGFDPETNTVYEFLGDYWHGNPSKYCSEDINPSCGKSYGFLYEETFERISSLEELGYRVVYIWEKDFLAREKNI